MNASLHAGTSGIHHVALLGRAMNRIAVAVTVRVMVANGGGGDGVAVLRAEAFEVGVDGSRPESPLAVSSPVNCHLSGAAMVMVDVPLIVGTPFLRTEQDQPGYAVLVFWEQGETVETGEIQFGFDAEGEIIVTRGFEILSLPGQSFDPRLPSLFIVGDSTAFSNGRNQRGWGDELSFFLDPTRVKVRNRARPGRSTRSFCREGLWTRVLSEVKPGDWVLIQFGHNDADKLAEGRYRGVLPGAGEETTEVMLPDGCHELVLTYGAYLRQFIADSQNAGATPVLLSLTVRNLWEEDRLVWKQSEYGGWAAGVAKANEVRFIDLTEMAADQYQSLGEKRVQTLFCSQHDEVHTSEAGARLNAGCVAAALRRLPGFFF